MASHLQPQGKRRRLETNSGSQILTNSCSLNSLNDDCLLEIFKFVPLEDLIHVCQDERSRCLIRDHVVSTKLADFTKITQYWSVEQIFQQFGKKLHRIKVSQYDTDRSFTKFIELIIEYCEPAQLLELQMYYSNTTVDQSLMQRALPYFSKIEKLLLLGDPSASSAYTDFLKTLCVPPFKPKALTLIWVELDRQWTQSTALANLEEIRIFEEDSKNGLTFLLKDKSQLKVLAHIGHNCSSPQLTAAITKCTNLAAYSYFDISADVYLPDFALYDQKEIASLPSMKHMSITSYTDNGSDINVWLEKPNELESLAILINSKDAPSLSMGRDARFPRALADAKRASSKWLRRWDKCSFEKLTSVGIWVHSGIYRETKSLVEIKFLLKLLSKLKNLKHVTINSICWSNISNIHYILKFIPNVQTLTFANVEIKDLSREMDQFAVALKKMNNTRQNTRPIKLIINKRQLQELQVNIFFPSSCVFAINITFHDFFISDPA